VIITGLATSMAVNTLVTGLIVFKILNVFLEYKPTSVERTLGSIRDTKLRHITFIIIESGMVLFAIQLVRIVLTSLRDPPLNLEGGLDIVIYIHQMLNVIIRSIHFYFFCLLTLAWLGHRTNSNTQ
jgi:hypothetical protein